MTATMDNPTTADPLADALAETGTNFAENLDKWREVMARQRLADEASERQSKELAAEEAYLKASGERVMAIWKEKKGHEDYVIRHRVAAETAVRRTMPAPLATMIADLEKRKSELSAVVESLREHIALVRQNLREEDATAQRNGEAQSAEPGRTARVLKIANAEGRRDEAQREIGDIVRQLAEIERAIFATD